MLSPATDKPQSPNWLRQSNSIQTKAYHSHTRVKGKQIDRCHFLDDSQQSVTLLSSAFSFIDYCQLTTKDGKFENHISAIPSTCTSKSVPTKSRKCSYQPADVRDRPRDMLTVSETHSSTDFQDCPCSSAGSWPFSTARPQVSSCAFPPTSLSGTLFILRPSS